MPGYSGHGKILNCLFASGGFDNFSLLDATCANAHPLRSSVYLCANRLEIRQPTAPCPVMGVADIIAANGSFSAYFTNFSHDFLKLEENYQI
jgi:hypothetical protein